MDIVEIVAGISGVRRVAELDDCWTWSTGGRFHFTLALTADGVHALQVSCRDYLDPELVIQVLRCARERSFEVLNAAPVAVLGHDFAPLSTKFDSVAAVAPGVHHFHQQERPELHAVTFAVFPAFQCEFSGMETMQEAVLRFRRMLDAANLLRAPQPWVRMRYDNPTTGGGSVGPDLGITTVDVFFRELGNLDGAEGAFIEVENFRGQSRRVAWHEGLHLTDGQRDQILTLDDTRTWANRFFREGVDK